MRYVLTVLLFASELFLSAGEPCGNVTQANCTKCGSDCDGWDFFHVWCWGQRICLTCQYPTGICPECGGHGVCQQATCGCTCQGGWWGPRCSNFDCLVGNWQPQGECSEPHCGGGTQLFARNILQNASGAGVLCPALTETRPCNMQPCPLPQCIHGVAVRHTGLCMQPCYGTWEGTTCNVSSLGQYADTIPGLMPPSSLITPSLQLGSIIPLQAEGASPFPVVLLWDGFLLSVDDMVCVTRQSIPCTVGNIGGVTMGVALCNASSAAQKWTPTAISMALGSPAPSFQSSETGVSCAIPAMADSMASWLEFQSSPLVVDGKTLNSWPGGRSAGLRDLLQLRQQAQNNTWVQADLVYQMWMDRYLTGNISATSRVMSHLCKTFGHQGSCLLTKDAIKPGSPIITVSPVGPSLRDATVAKLLHKTNLDDEMQFHRSYQNAVVDQLQSQLQSVNGSLATISRQLRSLMDGGVLQLVSDAVVCMKQMATQVGQQTADAWAQLKEGQGNTTKPKCDEAISHLIVDVALPFATQFVIPGLTSLLGPGFPSILSQLEGFFSRPGDGFNLKEFIQQSASLHDYCSSTGSSLDTSVPANPFSMLLLQVDQLQVHLMSSGIPAKQSNPIGPLDDTLASLMTNPQSFMLLFSDHPDVSCPAPPEGVLNTLRKVSTLVASQGELLFEMQKLTSELQLQQWVQSQLQQQDVPQVAHVLQATKLLQDRMATLQFYALQPASPIDSNLSSNLASPLALAQLSETATQLTALDELISVTTVQQKVSQWQSHTTQVVLAVDYYNCENPDFFASLLNLAPVLFHIDSPVMSPRYENIRVDAVQVVLLLQGQDSNQVADTIDISLTHLPISHYYKGGHWHTFAMPVKTFTSIFHLNTQTNAPQGAAPEKEEMQVSPYGFWTIRLSPPSHVALTDLKLLGLRIIFETHVQGLCLDTECGTANFAGVHEHVLSDPAEYNLWSHPPACMGSSNSPSVSPAAIAIGDGSSMGTKPPSSGLKEPEHPSDTSSDTSLVVGTSDGGSGNTKQATDEGAEQPTKSISFLVPVVLSSVAIVVAVVVGALAVYAWRLRNGKGCCTSGRQQQALPRCSVASVCLDEDEDGRPDRHDPLQRDSSCEMALKEAKGKALQKLPEATPPLEPDIDDCLRDISLVLEDGDNAAENYGFFKCQQPPSSTGGLK